MLYDVVIIGGGPAGLTCAIFLARYRRKVLVLDTGKPRNHATRTIHGFLGLEDIKPAELRIRGRRQAESAGAEFIDADARSVAKRGEHFEIQHARGTAMARRVVLAYGVRDIIPDLEGFENYYGSSAFHCPDCDGYEVRDLAVAVIGDPRKAANLAAKLLVWTNKITILTDGREFEAEKDDRDKLKQVAIKAQRIVRLRGEGDQLTGIELEGGETVPADAMFFSIGVVRCSPIAETLGCEVYADLPNVVVDENKETTVKGVYAIGDLVPGSQLAITSAADGAIAAIAINRTLLVVGSR